MQEIGGTFYALSECMATCTFVMLITGSKKDLQLLTGVRQN